MPTFLSSTLAAALAVASHSSSQSTDTPQPAPAPAAQSKSFFNPQISLVTDFRWNAINSDNTMKKRAFLKEAELGFAADVDPFLTAQAYISTEDDGTGTDKMETNVEEAFAIYSGLGKGLSLRVGKIAAAIGRVQRNHSDALNWMDFPLYIQDFFGDEGVRAGGASVSYLLPGERFHELTLEALNAKDSNTFMDSSSSNPLFVGHYRTFFDFGEDASAQLGFTYGSGPGGPGNKRSQIYGPDFVYKWTPGTSGKSLVFESEALWAKPGTPGTKQAVGGFAALTYQLSTRLFGTVKFDYSETPGTAMIQRCATVGLTLKPTEFHHWRAELQRFDSNFGPSRTVLNLQLQWVIGAHPAHKY